jgi:hypothetical protein
VPVEYLTESIGRSPEVSDGVLWLRPHNTSTEYAELTCHPTLTPKTTRLSHFTVYHFETDSELTRG